MLIKEMKLETNLNKENIKYCKRKLWTKKSISIFPVIKKDRLTNYYPRTKANENGS